MLNKEDILADLHTHTIFSGHAYSTLKEHIDELCSMGSYEFIGVTDHYFDDLVPLHKKNTSARLNYCKDRFNRFDIGIKVINGAEFNIGHYPQELYYVSNLDWKIIGLHNWMYSLDRKSLKQVEEEILFSLSLNMIKFNGLAHIERELHKLENGKYSLGISSEIEKFFDNIINFCKVNEIAMEVNESSIVFNEGSSVDRLKCWVKKAKENGNYIYLGTDAHSSYEVGKFDNCIKLLNDIDYPKSLILNCDRERLKELSDK